MVESHTCSFEFKPHQSREWSADKLKNTIRGLTPRLDLPLMRPSLVIFVFDVLYFSYGYVLALDKVVGWDVKERIERMFPNEQPFGRVGNIFATKLYPYATCIGSMSFMRSIIQQAAGESRKTLLEVSSRLMRFHDMSVTRLLFTVRLRHDLLIQVLDCGSRGCLRAHVNSGAFGRPQLRGRFNVSTP